jgi:hypothetical protein
MIYGDTRFPEHFWGKVYPEPNTACWLWGAGVDGPGRHCRACDAENKRRYRVEGRVKSRACVRGDDEVRWLT